MISIGSNSSVFVPRHSWSWKRVPAIGKRGWRWRTATANSPAGAAQGHGSGPVCVRCGAAGGLAQLQGEIRAQLSAGPKPVPTAAADRGPRAVCSNQPRRLAWPSYERCLEGAPESTSGGKKRSAADFTWCCIAIDHFRRTPAETADQTDGGIDEGAGKRPWPTHYVKRRAAAKVAANPRSRLRR